MSEEIDEVNSGGGGKRRRRGSESSEDSWISGVPPTFDFDEPLSHVDNSLEDDDSENTPKLLTPRPLIEQACKVLGTTWAYDEIIQRATVPLPDDVQQKIATYAFPSSERKIRMYASLCHRSPLVFSEAEQLLRKHRPRRLYQIGFQLCARFSQYSRRGCVQTNVSFDRGCVTSCSCSCNALTPWCSHVVAVCLSRIRDPNRADVRPTLTTSLMQMDTVQLRKLVQYLITDMPEQSLFAAQTLVDELLQPDSTLNLESGAPDITAGGLRGEHPHWLVDFATLEDTLRQQLISLLSKFTSGLPSHHQNQGANLLGAYEIFQRMSATHSYQEEHSFRVNYVSIITSLLKDGDPSALGVIQAISKVLPGQLQRAISDNRSDREVLEALACTVVHDLASLWMLVALSLPCDHEHMLGVELVSSLLDFTRLLPRDRSIASYDNSRLLANAVSFACERFSPKSEEETTSLEPTLESSYSASLDHLVSALGSASLGSVLPSMSLKSMSMDIDLLVSALTALLVYLRIRGRRPMESGRILAEAAAACIFPKRNLPLEDSDLLPASLVVPGISGTPEGYLALLELCLELLKALQRSTMAISCALRVLFSRCDQGCASPSLEVLLLRYEKMVLGEIDTWLSGQMTNVRDRPLLNLARSIASHLVASTPSTRKEGGSSFPPYCPAEAVFSLLAHPRGRGPLLRLGQSMVLHVLRLCPITGAVRLSPSTSGSGTAFDNELVRLCNWDRLETLLVKALEISNIYESKEITSTLESTFPSPPSSKVYCEERREHPSQTEPTSTEGESEYTGDKGSLSVSMADVRLLQKVVVDLSRRKKGQGIDKLALLELYLLSLRVHICLIPSWKCTQSSSFDCILKVSALVAEVGETALQLLYHKWPMCLSPTDVVGVVEELNKLTHKPYSTAAVCQVLKSVLHEAGSMEPCGAQTAIAFCCKAGPKYALEAVDVLIQLTGVNCVKSVVFFFVAQQLRDLHVLVEKKESEKEATRARVVAKPVVSSEDWEEDTGNGGTGSLPPSQPPESHLGPPSLSLNELPPRNQRCKLDPSECHGQSSSEKEAACARVVANPVVSSESWEEEDTTCSGRDSVMMSQAPESLLGPLPISLSALPHQKLTCDLELSRSQEQSSLATLPPSLGYNLAVVSVCLPKQAVPRLSQRLLQRAFTAGLKALEVLHTEQRDSSASAVDVLDDPEFASGLRTVTTIACTLGNQQILGLIEGVRSAVTSPFILHETALAIAKYLSQEHPHQLAIQLGREPLAALMREAVSQFTNCIRSTYNRTKTGVLIELIKSMRESAQYVRNGEEELRELLASLTHDKRLRRLLSEHFPEYVVVSKSDPMAGGRQLSYSNADHPGQSPYSLVASEYWDD